MNKIYLSVLILFIFSACATPQKQLESEAYKPAFAGEDAYIIFALRAEQLHDYKSAALLFHKLYKKSSKKEYLYRALSDELNATEYERIVKEVDALGKNSLDDVKLVRLKIVALVQLGRVDEAKLLAIKLADKTKEADDYLLASDIYIKEKEFNMALKYLESAYVQNYNEKILDKMSIILYVNLGRTKDAIAYLETHTRVNGCSKLICNRLIGIYSHENNIEGLLSTYKRLYNIDKSEKIAKKIIQIYAYKRDYIQLTSFLEESGADDDVLLQLYITAKNYDKAYKLADKLYKKSADINYLGQNAIYEYESSGKKISKTTLEDVINKLEKVVAQTQDPLYYNYLGYILIDHDVDVKKGMRYVRKVLKDNPDSAYYLDSLAWGYYKLGQCKKAKNIIDKVLTLEGGDAPEVLDHVKAIESCLKKHFKNNRGKVK